MLELGDNDTAGILAQAGQARIADTNDAVGLLFAFALLDGVDVAIWAGDAVLVRHVPNKRQGCQRFFNSFNLPVSLVAAPTLFRPKLIQSPSERRDVNWGRSRLN